MQILYPYKNALWALRPAKPLGVLSRHPCRNPKPLPRGEGLCMLCWLCIVQSLWAYTPGIHAGAECGAAALTPLGATPKARMLWLLAKSFARCKTNKASNARHPIFKNYIGLSTVCNPPIFCRGIFVLSCYHTIRRSAYRFR